MVNGAVWTAFGSLIGGLFIQALNITAPAPIVGPGFIKLIPSVMMAIQSFQLTSAFGQCRRDCRGEKRNQCITLALFCRRGFSCHLKSSKLSKKKTEKNPYTRTNTCLLHISRNFKDNFINMCFTLIFSKL